MPSRPARWTRCRDRLSFDANGDLSSRVVSVFQVQQDTAHPVNDVVHQFKYIGVALADNS